MRFFDFMRRRPSPSAPSQEAPARGKLKFSGAMQTDVGRVRTSNEDAVVYFVGGEEDAEAFDLVAAVADGMGGHAAGEVASAIAAATLRKALNPAKAEPRVALESAIREANAAIREHARSHPETQGMGTTCTVALVSGDALWIGHIGDTRAYLLRDGVLEQLSEDHTLRAQLLRDGDITEEHETGAAASLLLRALGAADEAEPMVTSVGRPLLAEDRLMLCSDGLHGVVGAEEIRSALQLDEPRLACERLVAATLDAGAPDNVSVGVFRFFAPTQGERASNAPTRPFGLSAAPVE